MSTQHLETIVANSEGQDSVVYMSESTFEKIYDKNPNGGPIFIQKTKDRILLHYETTYSSNGTWPFWSKVLGRGFLEIRIEKDLQEGKLLYEKRAVIAEPPSQLWPLGYQASPPTFVRAPIIRGVTEVRLLMAMLDIYGGFISGSYAVFCCSSRKHTSSQEPGDIDVYLPGPEAFDKFCADMRRLGFDEYVAPFSHYYRMKLDFVPGNHRDWISSVPAMSQQYAGLYLCPKQINVIKPDSLDLTGVPTKGSDVKEKLAARVLGLFDTPACRVALLSENYAVSDIRFAEQDCKKTAIFDSFRSPEMIIDRITKYRIKGYNADVTSDVRSHRLLAHKHQDLQQALQGSLSKLKKKSRADSGAHTP